MPIVSPERIQELTRILRDGNFQQKLDCLRATAFDPPNDLPDLPMISGVRATDAMWGRQGPGGFEKSKMTDVGEMVSYIRLVPSVKTMEKYGSVSFQMKYARSHTGQDAAAGFDIPAWFLPWRKAGGLVKLKISDVGSNAGQLAINQVNHANPGLFLTAALSGCSVIVVGNPKNPSVYHGGSQDTPLTLNDDGRLVQNETTEAFWLRKGGRTGTQAKPLGSIGKTDYISELTQNPRSNDDRMDRETTLSRAIKKRLVDSGGFDSVDVIPWGYVFGLRQDDGTWVFELVKCVTLSYYKWRLKKPALGRNKWVKETERRVSGLSGGGGSLAIDPITGGLSFKRVQIAAQGAGQVFYDPIGPDDYSEQKIADCKAIAYQRFFPGQGETHVHNLKGSQLFAKLIV